MIMSFGKCYYKELLDYSANFKKTLEAKIHLK